MSTYKVKNASGMEVCTGILQLFYGNLWSSALNRLNHQFDGYVRSLYYKGEEYRVYRRFHDDEPATLLTINPPARSLTAVRSG